MNKIDEYKKRPVAYPLLSAFNQKMTDILGSVQLLKQVLDMSKFTI